MSGGGHGHGHGPPGAGHLALVAAVLAGRPATQSRTWGYRRAEVLAAAAQAAVLLAVGGFVLAEAIRRLIELSPKGVDLAHVRAHTLGVPHVHVVHDLHASSVPSDLPVLTAHVVVDDSCFRDGYLPRLLDQLQQCLAGHFDVEHSTVQFEPASHAAHEHAAHA